MVGFPLSFVRFLKGLHLQPPLLFLSQCLCGKQNPSNTKKDVEADNWGEQTLVIRVITPQKKMGDKIPGQYKSRRGGETVGVLKRNKRCAGSTHTGNPSPLRDSWEPTAQAAHSLQPEQSLEEEHQVHQQTWGHIWGCMLVHQRWVKCWTYIYIYKYICR